MLGAIFFVAVTAAAVAGSEYLDRLEEKEWEARINEPEHVRHVAAVIRAMARKVRDSDNGFVL